MQTSTTSRQFNTLERRLLDEFQQQLPLSATPYADMAQQLGVSEETVLETLTALQQEGVVSRIGPVLAPNRVGASTLVAMSVPAAELDGVANRVSAFAEVNHNYERRHDFNLWFVVTASSEQHVQQVLAAIEEVSGYPLMSLPMLEDYYIDLGFDIAWD